MNKKSLIKYGVAALILAAAAIALVTVVSIKPMEKEEEGMGLTVDPYSGTYTAPGKSETEEDSGGIAIPGWGSISLELRPLRRELRCCQKISSAGRYKALGNSVALPCACYIMAGIREALNG